MPGGEEKLQKQRRKSVVLSPTVFESESQSFSQAFTYEDIYAMEHDRDMLESVVQISEAENSIMADDIRKTLPPVQARNVSDGEPVQTLPAVKNSLQVRREQQRRSDEAKKQSPVGDHISYVINRDIKQWEQERSNSLANLVNGNLDEDANLLLMPLLNGYRKSPNRDQLDPGEQKKYQQDKRAVYFYNEKEQGVLLSLLAGEIKEIKLSGDMFTEEYLEKNSVELIQALNKMEAMYEIMKNPSYEQAVQSMKEADREEMRVKLLIVPAFRNLLSNRLAAKGIKLNGEYIGKENIRTALEAPLPEHRKRYEKEFEDALQKAGMSKSEEQSETELGETVEEQPQEVQQQADFRNNVFRYGMPDMKALKAFLQEKTGVDKKFVNKLLSGKDEDVKSLRYVCNSYHAILKAEITDQSIVKSDLLMDYHRSFVNLCAKIAEKAATSKNKNFRLLSGALGFAAMRAQTYAGMVANLHNDLLYSVKAEEHTETLKEQMDRDGLGAQYEGVHSGRQYIKKQSVDENLFLPRLDTKLRDAVRSEGNNAGDGYRNDSEFVAIVQTCEAYENFIRSAQVPPCRTPAEKAAYKKDIFLLINRLHAYNDRIAALTMRYLEINTKRIKMGADTDATKKKKDRCNVLKDTILDEHSKQYHYERVALLAQRLRNNDFSDAGFNAACTGVVLSEALRNTRLEEVTLEARDYSKKGDALSEVYVRRRLPGEQRDGEEAFVYRKGSDYDSTWDRLHSLSVDMLHLNEVKGNIASFSTMDGQLVDSHKTRRDVAVSLVDKMLGANVIAESSQAMFKFENTRNVLGMGTAVTELTLGTKMAEAHGRPAADLMGKFQLPSKSGRELGSYDDETGSFDLGNPVTMTNMFWLQAIDIICGATDRHLNNVFVERQEDNSIKLTGIDNDLAFGSEFPALETMEDHFAFLNAQKERFFGVDISDVLYFVPVIENAFPCVPKTVYDSVMNLDGRTFAENLRGYLRDNEVVKAVERLKVLQNYFERLNQENKVYDLEKEEELTACQEAVHNKMNDIALAVRKDSENYGHYIASSYFSLFLYARR